MGLIIVSILCIIVLGWRMYSIFKKIYEGSIALDWLVLVLYSISVLCNGTLTVLVWRNCNEDLVLAFLGGAIMAGATGLLIEVAEKADEGIFE